ncbi:Flp pilus assembly protein CpaB [Marinibactrum halimedae]|uniref:SAF domain-containing protein n=1 Tax=Marinibactrum halimedae TaxID=1444977 RepID=A0AA37WJM5_9GAMM|nr:Flp pilus assembly protein CpaB [Marinibactrum halimedae]MCD9460290.1 Flp pilus assembly protein CpaB [Marinibactrum halimedae]GLS24378.1 hypothetical protein GCM10007877_00890 [Marinibactrum halimedae]
MKKYTSIGLLIVALIFSGLAAVASIKYLEKREQDLISKLDQKNDTEVIVPSRDLVVGDVISTETVSVRAVPSTFLPSGALYPSDFDAIAGLSIKEPVFSGKPVLRSQLEGLSGVETFSELLQEGQRAITLPIDELQSNENMLVPGDYVDLLIKIKHEASDKTGDKETVSVNSLLHRVLILATGPITIADPSYYYSTTQMEGQGYGTITIGVNSKEVPKILAASEMGELIYLMRNPEDKSKGRFNEVGDAWGVGWGEGNTRKIRVFSAESTSNGLMVDEFRSIGEDNKNNWGNPIDPGRLYKKYNKDFLKKILENEKNSVEVGQL